ncbi:uncharacterized protein [Panulirus ornatus]|uniref:uncharacterized protein isoform X9 n=1 Tax=Panulirus ornatus TaxID=150431 RepID=UPI003A8BF2F3
MYLNCSITAETLHLNTRIFIVYICNSTTWATDISISVTISVAYFILFIHDYPGESFASRKIVLLYNLRVFLHGSVVLYAGESFTSRKIVVLYNLRVFLHGRVLYFMLGRALPPGR